jgi:regulator of protease activity HflC (stomatin/prohibitin superfamily)
MIRPFRRFAKWVDDHLLSLLLGFLGLAMAIVVLWPFSVIDIPPGYMGVRWSRFGGGTVLDKVYHEGIRVIPPWDRMYLYNVRLQRMSKTYQLLTKGSLQVQVSVDFIYRPYEPWLPYIHRFVGPDYAETVLAPVVASETRNAFATFTPDRGLTEDRTMVSQSIERTVNQYLLERFNPPKTEQTDDVQQNAKYIAIEGVLINEITLPATVADAIAAKNAVREKVETYAYILQAEHREAERKAIEATGIKAFSENVGNGLTDEYLKLKTIELMMELAKSPNSKVVVLGGTPGSLPLVLGADGNPISTPSPLPPGVGARPAAPPAATPPAATPPK